MDKQALAVLIPVLAVFFTGITIFSRTLIGRAIAKRIEGSSGGPGSPELEERLQLLEQEMGALRGELAETHERLDFTERMLAQVREAQRLPPGKP